MIPDLSTETGTQKNNALVLLATLLMAIALSYGVFSKTEPYKPIDLFFYDRFMKADGRPELSNEIVNIDIDEASLSQLGQWPWPRYRLAELIREINTMQPRAIALDILLSEPDRTSLKHLKTQFKTDFQLDLEFPGIPKVLTDNDAYLAHIISQSRTVGARYFHFDHTTVSPPCKDPPVSFMDESDRLRLHQATGALCNIFLLEQAFESSGFTNSGYDRDGILRRLPLLIQYQDQIFPHLSLATLLKAGGISQISIRKNELGPYIKAGPYTIPVTSKGEVMIRFSGPGRTHKYISAARLLNKGVPPSEIKEKIVLIGSSAVGLNDIHHTPWDAHYPGIEVQASVLESILKNQTVILPQWGNYLVAATGIAAGMIMALLFVYFPSPVKLLSGTILLILLTTCLGYYIFRQWSVFISPGLPVLIAVFLFPVFSFARFVLARRASIIWFKKLALSQQLTLEAMVSMVETRDPETGAHIKRTQYYAKALALHLRQQGIYTRTLTPAYIEMLYLSVPLHDIGKVGIPDRILLKEGPLTDEEFEIMKRHAVYGRQTIERAAQRIKGENYLKMGAQIAGTHHEKWNGTGYPENLSGEGIPLSGRIMAICDVYDALISRRCYKPAFSHEKSMDIILQHKGAAFDPVLVDGFFAIENRIKDISLKYQDPD